MIEECLVPLLIYEGFRFVRMQHL